MGKDDIVVLQLLPAQGWYLEGEEIPGFALVRYKDLGWVHEEIWPLKPSVIGLKPWGYGGKLEHRTKEENE